MELQNDTNRNISYCLYSSISSESIQTLVDFIINMKQETTLNLYINSRGGIVPVAIVFFNFIKSIKGLKINTYNMGHCDSAATLIFMLGQRKYVLKNASFYMHSLQLKLPYPQTINTLKNELKNITEDTNIFINLLVNNSNISKKQWNLWMNDKGTLIKAKKAVSMGIAEYLPEEEKGK